MDSTGYLPVVIVLAIAYFACIVQFAFLYVAIQETPDADKAVRTRHVYQENELKKAA